MMLAEGLRVVITKCVPAFLPPLCKSDNGYGNVGQDLVSIFLAQLMFVIFLVIKADFPNSCLFRCSNSCKIDKDLFLGLVDKIHDEMMGKIH